MLSPSKSRSSKESGKPGAFVWSPNRCSWASDSVVWRRVSDPPDGSKTRPHTGPVSAKKIRTRSRLLQSSMSEGVRVVAGSVIVSDAMAAAQSGEDTLEATVREHARLVYRIAYS